MMAILGGFRRNWRQFNPPVVSKQDDVLKFGILVAARIALVVSCTHAQANSGPTVLWP